MARTILISVVLLLLFDTANKTEILSNTPNFQTFQAPPYFPTMNSSDQGGLGRALSAGDTLLLHAIPMR